VLPMMDSAGVAYSVKDFFFFFISKKSEESIDHLLLHCEVARDFWSYILILFGVEWVMPQTVLELLNS
jgi:hypothetical protein